MCLGSTAAGCASAYFFTKGISYKHICRQAKGYQKGTPDSFISRSPSVDSGYVEGISITIGSPHKYVWTYTIGHSDNYDYSNVNCPCATHPGPSPPPFVGNDYYCKSINVGKVDISAYYLSDPLWDGNGCTTS